MKNLIDYLRKCFFHLRSRGIRGLYQFIKLNKFEKKVFSNNRKLKWNKLGYWEVSPMPTEEELKNFYSKIYWMNNHVYKERFLIERDLDHFYFIQKYTDIFNQKKINFLNYGAGHGGISYLIYSKYGNVVNIEPSEIYNEKLKNFYSFNFLNDFRQSQIKDLKFDLIYSSHTLEHLVNPVSFLEEMSGLLNEEGCLFIEVPNCRKKNLDINYSEGGCDGKIHGSHLIYFTKDFFDNLHSKPVFISEKKDLFLSYSEVLTENDADCLRVIIKKKNIKNFLNNL